MEHDFDEVTKADVAAKARELKRNALFRDWEREDIEQDLYLYLCEQRPKFDPARGDWTMFSRAMLRNKASEMISDRMRVNEQMRRREGSLNEIVARDDDGTPLTLAEVIPQNAGLSPEAVCLRLDWETATADLPEPHRRVVELLLVHTQSEVAEIIGISRFAFRRRYSRTIRRVLAVLR